jgi:hypothetical protein
MSDSRHFTVVDDWVLLHPDVTSTEYRIYSIIKGNLKHTHGGVPETGFRATAAWVNEISGGLVSVSTAHKAMQALAKKGILRRLNNPQSGEGADFEFVVVPPEEYAGPKSVMAEAAAISKKKSRSVVFVTVPLNRRPRKGARQQEAQAQAIVLMDEEAEEPEPEFDMSGLQAPVPSGAEAEFAVELEEITARNIEPRLRLMSAACERVAAAVRPALEVGWNPRELALRMAAELNPRVNAPERLLISKAGDLGKPPKARIVMPEAPKEDEQLNRYVPPKQFHQRPGLEISPEEQEKIDARLREYQAQRERANLLKS